MNTDKIEKKTLLKAPLSRVWRAISQAQEFGAWFGLALGLVGVFIAFARSRLKAPPPRADEPQRQT